MTPAELKKQQDSLLQDYTKKSNDLKNYKKNMLTTISGMQSKLNEMVAELNKIKID